MRVLAWLLVVEVTALAVCCGAVGLAWADAVLVDDFDDGTCDSAKWDSGGSPWVAERNGQVETTIPADAHQTPPGDSFGAGYISRHLLHGDFDVRVDYHLLTWPGGNGVRVGLNIITASGEWRGNIQRVSRGPSEVPGQPREWYSYDYAGVLAHTMTSDTSGTLRWVRRGTSLTGYYLSGSNWVVLGSTSSTGDTRFCFSAWSHDYAFSDRQVAVAFDNFVARADGIVPSVPPAIMGVVRLEDFTGDVAAVPVSVQLRPQDGAVENRTLMLASDGSYILHDIEPGTYDIAFKASHWLQKVVGQIVVPQQGLVEGVDVSLPNGDCNGDNGVGFADFNMMRAAWASSPESPNWNPGADLNGSGTVGLADFNILRKNWGLQGDE